MHKKVGKKFTSSRLFLLILPTSVVPVLFSHLLKAWKIAEHVTFVRPSNALENHRSDIYRTLQAVLGNIHVSYTRIDQRSVGETTGLTQFQHFLRFCPLTVLCQDLPTLLYAVQIHQGFCLVHGIPWCGW